MRLSQKLENEIRSKITESYERKRLIGEIDRIRAYIHHLGGVTDTCTYPIIGQICDGCKCGNAK